MVRKIKPGIAFGEGVHTEQIPHRQKSKRGRLIHTRAFIFPLFTIGACTVILLKLIALQLFQGGYYRSLSDTNRIRTVLIHAPRGVIFDRSKIPLVLNVPGFRESENGKTVFISKDNALSKIAQGDKSLEIDSLREYTQKDIAAHILGYVGQISQAELSLPQFSNYQVDSVVGKMGIEKQYENVLRGVDGKQLFEVNANGTIVKKLGQTDSI